MAKGKAFANEMIKLNKVWGWARATVSACPNLLNGLSSWKPFKIKKSLVISEAFFYLCSATNFTAW